MSTPTTIRAAIKNGKLFLVSIYKELSIELAKALLFYGKQLKDYDVH